MTPVRRTALAITLAAMLLPSCGGYSAEFRGSFLRSCMESSDGDAEYCGCVLDHLETNGPEDEKQITAADQARAIRACLNQKGS